MKVKLKTIVFDAVQWIKNGDHPGDDVWRPFEDTGKRPTEPREGKVVRYFRRPDIKGETKCERCGATFHAHGWIDSGGDGVLVCPGDYVINQYGAWFSYRPDAFRRNYEPAEAQEDQARIDTLVGSVRLGIRCQCGRTATIPGDHLAGVLASQLNPQGVTVEFHENPLLKLILPKKENSNGKEKG